MPSGVTHVLVSFCSLRYHFNAYMGFYSGLSGRVRTVYLCLLCVVSLLSGRFTAIALLWFSHFLKCLLFRFFISLSTVIIYRSLWILWLFMYQGALRMDRGVTLLLNCRVERIHFCNQICRIKFLY
jgi:hypothetical protein